MATVVITKLTRKRAKKIYDLKAFEGYEGEIVSDGIQRDFRELLYSDLTFDKKIGEGAFGRVFLGYWRGTTIVAIKELNVQADPKAKVEFIHEANIMFRVGNHPNVVHFIGAVTTEDRFYTVSEFAKNGSLLDVLGKGRVRITPFKRLEFALGAAVGVAHLHAEGVVHRDIAARNFLVSKDLTVMVTDFGLSRIVETSAGSEAVAARTQSNIGPVRWMAPESISRKEYSMASDVWMFGCFLYELATGSVPFADLGIQDVVVAVCQQQRHPDLPVSGTEPLILGDLMRQCWVQNPAQRPD